MRFVGDVHGKWDKYKKIMKLGVPTIALGDVGIGFRHCGGPRDGEFSSNPPHRAMVQGSHRFIRGNHDNPHVCSGHSQFINDGTTKDGIMYVGGAFSIDRAWRTEGYDWWADEELSISDLNEMVDIYQEYKPKVMVTHDCAESVANILFGVNGKLKISLPSRTRQALQSMFEIHTPKLWLFGHWHESKDMVINGTRFICLAELESRDIDLSEI